MTTPRKAPSVAQLCGTDKCMFARDSHQIIERLSLIERQLAIMNENWIKLERFVHLEETVVVLEKKIQELRTVVFGFCGLILMGVVGDGWRS